MIQNLDFVKTLGFKSKKYLEQGNLNKFAELMNIHWEYKKTRSNKMTNKKITQCYKDALKNNLEKIICREGLNGLITFVKNLNRKQLARFFLLHHVCVLRPETYERDTRKLDLLRV